MPRGLPTVVAMLALVAVMPLALAACAAPGGSGPAGGKPPSSNGTTGAATSSPGPAGRTPVAPGVYDLSGGRIRVVGTLVHSSIEGGFWGIVAGKSARESAPVTIVVANARDLGIDLTPLRGSVVVAEGRLRGGVSTRMVGPEMQADSLVLQRDYRPSEPGTPRAF